MSTPLMHDYALNRLSKGPYRKGSWIRRLMYIAGVLCGGVLFFQADVLLASLALLLAACGYVVLGMPTTVRSMVALGILVLVKVLHFVYLDPLSGPDEIRFYREATSHSSYVAFLQDYFSLVQRRGFMSSSVPALSVVVMPIYQLFGTSSPLLMVAVNTFFHVCNVLLVFTMTKRYSSLAAKYGTKFSLTLASLLLVSPVLLFYSSTFSKDTITLTMCLLVVTLLLRKHFLLALPVLIYASLLRPYAISIVFAYYALLSGRYTLLKGGAVGSLAVLAIAVGFNPALFSNAALMAGYTFLSPNPFTLSNWSDLHLAFLSLEGALLGGVVLVSVVMYMGDPTVRAPYIRLMYCVVIYASVLALVGYTNIEGNREVYRIGYVGDNMVRKKLLVVPIVYIYVTLTILRAKLLLSRYALRTAR